MMIHQTYTASNHPKTPPGSHEMSPPAAAALFAATAYHSYTHPGGVGSAKRVLSLVTLTFDPDIRTRTRFLYNASNRQSSLI